MPPTITLALFHQSSSDMSCQVKWSGQGYAPEAPNATGALTAWKFVATGRATVEVYDRLTGKVLRTATGEFVPFTMTRNVPVVDGREYTDRTGKPANILGVTVMPGQSVRVTAVYYTAVFIGDLTNGTGALMTVDPDPGYPPQVPI